MVARMLERTKWLWIVLACVVLGCRGGGRPRPDSGPDALPAGDAAAEGIDPAALRRLVETARSEHSEALVVVKNGKLVYEDTFGFDDEPLFAMSASKSFVALAFGFLVAEGKASLDDRVATLEPAFAADPWKAKITYRHLLSQTSGLDPKRAMVDSPADIEARAIASRCLFEPGTSFQYSNGGVDFLAALAGKLAGKPMDLYLEEKLFRRLGIRSASWKRDAKGVPFGAGEMRIRPRDLAKVGAMLADGGRWRGEPIIAPGWIADQASPSSPFEPQYGLLWWRVADVTSVGLTEDVVRAWRAAGVADATLGKVTSLVGRAFNDKAELRGALEVSLSADELRALDEAVARGDHVPKLRPLAVGPAAGYAAAGWLGQYLVVIPEKKLVAVRMRRPRSGDYSDTKTEADGFRAFPNDVARLAGVQAS